MDWTEQFDSETLKSLIGEAINANPRILASRFRTQAELASRQGARGVLFPSLSANLNASQTSYGNAIGRPDEDSYGFGLSSSWEIDLWGQVAKGIRTVDADYGAAIAEYRALQLSIAGQTANAWIRLSNALAQLNLSKDEVEARSRATRLTERRVATGLTSTLDVRLTRSAEAGAKSTLADAELTLRNAARSLEVLLGRYPSAEMEANDTIIALPPIVDLSSPMEILSNRPDLIAAEKRLISAGMRADLARLAMRPSLTLSANGDITSETIEDVFDLDALVGRALANMTAPIFQGGRLAKDAEAAWARARASFMDYANSVLSAWQEVENARDADISLEAQELALDVSLSEARAAETLAERQYQNGLISIFDFIDAQTRRISSERQLLNVRAARAQNRVDYQIALGGGLVAAAIPEVES
jgi:NodT family efflux transporter outer membrane factor (OMF) lipoprotein